MSEKPLLCLDFDGVLCNSVIECFVSSWVGFFHLYRKLRPSTVSFDEIAIFRAYRPFIRSGEDYIILQECIYEGISVTSQNDFDRIRGSYPDEKIEAYRDIFYTARTNQLKEDKTTWLRLNPLFPEVSGIIDRIAASEQSHIVSTKKEEFIKEILSAAGVQWAIERIHCTGNTSKLLFIQTVMEETGSKRALFFDDQLDHFRTKRSPGIEGYIPSWGYVKEEWLSADVLTSLQVEAINGEEFRTLMKTYCDS